MEKYEPVEIPLKLKYRTRKPARRRGRGNYNGNSGISQAPKGNAHPDVFGYRREGYKCEAKWNPKAADDGEI